MVKMRLKQNSPQPQRYANRKYARKLDELCVAKARGSVGGARINRRSK